MSNEEQKICHYNQSGFCKYKEKCLNKHLNQTCHQTGCKDSVCRSEKRHPKECKKFQKYKNGDFNEKCAYLHVHTNAGNYQHELNIVMCEVAAKHKN